MLSQVISRCLLASEHRAVRVMCLLATLPGPFSNEMPPNLWDVRKRIAIGATIVRDERLAKARHHTACNCHTLNSAGSNARTRQLCDQQKRWRRQRPPEASPGVCPVRRLARSGLACGQPVVCGVGTQPIPVPAASRWSALDRERNKLRIRANAASLTR